MKVSSLFNLLHYKQAYSIYSLLKYNKNANHILIRYTHSEEYLTNYNMILTIYTCLFGDLLRQNNPTMELWSNSNTYYIKCSTIKNIGECSEFIRSIISSYNHYKNTKNYIILDDFSHLSYNFQNTLKQYIEKAYETTHFCIISSDLKNITNHFRDMFCFINIKPLTLSEKYIYLTKVFSYKNIDHELLYQFCHKYTIDEIVIKIQNKDYIYMNDYLLTCINDFFKSSFSITTVKELSYSLIKKKKDFISVMKQWLYEYIYHSSITLQKYHSIINALNLCKSKDKYRDIIYLETILVDIYHIINII